MKGFAVTVTTTARALLNVPVILECAKTTSWYTPGARPRTVSPKPLAPNCWPKKPATSDLAPPYVAAPMNTGAAFDPGFGYAQTWMASTPLSPVAPAASAQPVTPTGCGS